jgi:GrpB-like predicted nucleotidyltransferase (UPF0157 family)
MPEDPALGLARSKTIVKAHDPHWAAAFETEAASLRSALGETCVSVEHIGSTAVPGLAAKPIVDIAAGCADPSRIAEVHSLLESTGYVFHGDQGDEGGLLFIKGPQSSRTHYLHVVPIDSGQWKSYLRFRDALRASPKLREEYATLKRRLAERYPNDRLSYLEGKAGFIEGVLGGGSA